MNKLIELGSMKNLGTKLSENNSRRHLIKNLGELEFM